MSRFNLLDEPWIGVIVDDKGRTEEVGLKELFEKAHLYKDLAGDTKTQDFVILRLLLAVVHTVFSRFDSEGQVYEGIYLDENFRQLEKVDESDADTYEDALVDTWADLWERGSFPEIVGKYLEKWRDRFYLYDENYPFFQVRKEDIEKVIDLKTTKGTIWGKNIDRKLSESANKEVLFSYKNSSNNNKEILSDQEIARWLLSYQAYSGTGEKVKFLKVSKNDSKGWVYDLGGLYLGGDNLFETLMLNYCLIYEGSELLNIQKPCWEQSSREIIENNLSGNLQDNIAGLYTVWSRGIYIDSNHVDTDAFSLRSGKLVEVNHKNNFLEPMTLWIYKEERKGQGDYFPRKHQAGKSLWRSFGLMTLNFESEDEKKIKPGLIDWYNFLEDNMDFPEHKLSINAVSMKDDGTAASWVPTDEILDKLVISNYVLTDLAEEGWIARINEAVDLTSEVVESTYRRYVNTIRKIRNIQGTDFVNSSVEDLYFKIDQPFRNWLASIRASDSQSEKFKEWKDTLKDLVIEEGKSHMRGATGRDYTGITEGDKVVNIATAYNNFRYFIKRQLG